RKIHNLSEEVHSRFTVAAVTARKNVPGASNLEVDVPQVTLLHDLDQLRTPRDVLRASFGAFAAASAGRRRIQPRVIDNEVNVREILCHFCNVFWMTVLFVEQAERKPFVDADVLYSELATALPEWISDLLIVEPERPVSNQRTGIHLPRVDFQDFSLALHFFELGFTHVRSKEAVADHALSAACQPV